MKKRMLIIALGASAAIILTKIGFFDALMIFVLVGAIPGTNYSLPSSFMLIASLAAMWFLLFRWAALKTISGRAAKKLTKRHVKHKKQLPKRRFSEV